MFLIYGGWAHELNPFIQKANYISMYMHMYISLYIYINVFLCCFCNYSFLNDQIHQLLFLMLLDLSGIYHSFLKFFLLFISQSWGLSCGVKIVVVKKLFCISVAFLLSLCSCSSSLSPSCVNVFPFSFLLYVPFLGNLIHSHCKFTIPKSVYSDQTSFLCSKPWKHNHLK